MILRLPQFMLCVYVSIFYHFVLNVLFFVFFAYFSPPLHCLHLVCDLQKIVDCKVRFSPSLVLFRLLDVRKKNFMDWNLPTRIIPLRTETDLLGH